MNYMNEVAECFGLFSLKASVKQEEQKWYMN